MKTARVWGGGGTVIPGNRLDFAGNLSAILQPLKSWGCIPALAEVTFGHVASCPANER
jgi:hypothetical protein